MKKRNLLPSIFMAIVLSACNLPSGNGSPDGGGQPIDELALTVTAQSILLNQTTNAPEFTAAPQFTFTPEFTATPQFTSTPEFTATPTVPQVSVTTDTNCRSGPGVAYGLLGGLIVGQTAEVVGKNSSTGYWIIKLPSSSTTCWLFPQYATVSGNTANLPEYPVPPTPTPSLPAAPKNFKIADKTCTLIPATFEYTVTVKLSWNDVADNETGYRIYEDGIEIVALAANSTLFTYNTTMPMVPPPWSPAIHTYTIETYNSAGKSNQKEVILQCQL